MTVAAEEEVRTARPGRWWRSRPAQAVLSLAVVALIFGFFFPRVADYGEVWKTIAAMTPIELVSLALVAVGLFAVLLRSEQMAGRVGTAAGRMASGLRSLVRRPPVVGWDERAMSYRSDIVVLLERRWVLITVTTMISQVSLYFVLLVALRHVGVSNAEVSWQEVLAAFAFVRLVSAVPITPGGVGCWMFWRSNRSWRHTLDERWDLWPGDDGIIAARQPAIR